MTLLGRLLKLTLSFSALLGLVACALHASLTTEPGVPAKADGAHRIATHNVHYIWLNRAEGAWSRGDWDARAPAMDAAFKALDADILAFQEMESFAGGNSDRVNLTRAYLLIGAVFPRPSRSSTEAAVTSSKIRAGFSSPTRPT